MQDHPLMNVQSDGTVNIWSLGDGPAVASVCGKDGAMVTVMLRTGEVEVELKYQGQEWHQTVRYNSVDGGSVRITPSDDAGQTPMRYRQADDRPRAGRRKVPPLTMDQLTGG